MTVKYLYGKIFNCIIDIILKERKVSYMSQKHLRSIKVGHFKHTAVNQTEVMPIPDEVTIPLSQHIGAPCTPIVKKGDTVKVGQPIGESDAFVSAPIHSSVSGTVVGIETLRNPMGDNESVVVIEADKKQEVWEGVKPPEIKDHASFVEAVKNSGLVGLGGASFPTHIKMNPKNIAEVDTLIVNAAECEPFITSDHRAMLENGLDLLDGMKLIMEYLGLKHAYIGIENNKMDAIEHLNKLIDEQGLSETMETFALQARYPKGAERVLVYEVTGKTMDAGVLPADLGIILSNVTTITFIGQYAKTGMPLVSKRITVDGDAVKEPKNVIAPVGAKIVDVIDFCGGYAKEPKKILMGGPMMGRALFSDQLPIVKSTNAILAFSSAKAIIPEETACINCGRCVAVCPFNLLPTELAKAFEEKDVEQSQLLRVEQCMECGSCSYICPARRPLAFMNKLGKELVKEAQKNGKETK